MKCQRTNNFFLQPRLNLKIVLVFLIGSLFPIYISINNAYATGPANISTGLLLWLDATDPDGNGDATDNPTDGSSLSTWTDKSGNSFNATTLGGSWTAPVYKATSGINSGPAIRFTRTANASGNGLKVNGVDIRATSKPDVTIFSVYKAINTVNGQLYGVWGQDNGNWDRFFICCGYGSATNGVVGRGNSGYTVSGAGNGTTRLVTTIYDGDTSTGTNSGTTAGSKIFFDGSLVDTFTDVTNITDAQTNFRIGLDGDDSTYNGDIAEIIIYDRILSDADVNTVSVYLADKYGITLAPTVTTNAATSITQTTATLNGVVNAHSDTTTSITLRYSTSSATVGSGTSPTVSPSSASGTSDLSLIHI